MSLKLLIIFFLLWKPFLLSHKKIKQLHMLILWKAVGGWMGFWKAWVCWADRSCKSSHDQGEECFGDWEISCISLLLFLLNLFYWTSVWHMNLISKYSPHHFYNCQVRVLQSLFPPLLLVLFKALLAPLANGQLASVMVGEFISSQKHIILFIFLFFLICYVCCCRLFLLE